VLEDCKRLSVADVCEWQASGGIADGCKWWASRVLRTWASGGIADVCKWWASEGHMLVKIVGFEGLRACEDGRRAKMAGVQGMENLLPPHMGGACSSTP
jgi:hypothetical protein